MTNTLQIDKILPPSIYEDMKYISKYTELPLEKIILVSSIWGFYRYKIPVSMNIDKFISFDEAQMEEDDKIYTFWSDIKARIEFDFELVKDLETLEKKFNNRHPSKISDNPKERHFLFLKFLEEQPVKEGVSTLPQEESVQEKIVEPSKLKIRRDKVDTKKIMPEKKSTMRMHLQFLLKSGIFILFFMAPILLLLIISNAFFYWNYLTILKYQPVFFLLLIIVMILSGLVFGWVSILLTRQYQSKTLYRKDKHEYKKFKSEFNEEIPYREFKGTPTQWYQQLEKFIESKKKV